MWSTHGIFCMKKGSAPIFNWFDFLNMKFFMLRKYHSDRQKYHKLEFFEDTLNSFSLFSFNGFAYFWSQESLCFSEPSPFWDLTWDFSLLRTRIVNFFDYARYIVTPFPIYSTQITKLRASRLVFQKYSISMSSELIFCIFWLSFSLVN